MKNIITIIALISIAATAAHAETESSENANSTAQHSVATDQEMQEGLEAIHRNVDLQLATQISRICRVERPLPAPDKVDKETEMELESNQNRLVAYSWVSGISG